MSTTHIFIVNDRTFKYHLEYMFAGTCAISDVPFIENVKYENTNGKDDKEGITPRMENAVMGMIADISRIRENDKIIFYLTKGEKEEGLFFGTFKVVGEPFYNTDDDNYLSDELGTKLNFRVNIKPDKVYRVGVSEHMVLDYIDEIQNPNEMCWSLIYRKLRGKRGCTMITPKESERIIALIQKKNSNVELDGKGYTYDYKNHCIKETNNIEKYQGVKKSLDVFGRMKNKKENGKAYEAHLQAYITKNIDKTELKKLLDIDENVPLWIGNEVACGVGEQSIDIMTIQEKEEYVNINVIELKYSLLTASIIINQLPWYVEWVRQYISSIYKDKVVYINPIVIASKFKRDTKNKSDFFKQCEQYKFISDKNTIISKIKYISHNIDDMIHFE